MSETARLSAGRIVLLAEWCLFSLMPFVFFATIAAVAFLAFFPVRLLVVFIQKHLASGLTLGAVKG